ncbi:unnamed protein product [Pieris macdunnoughi]|uniref:BESS domain-containing protein n=1 Tax=Pieris macdunnoughi TaxID=345717 RepID=A0A821YCE6_9NEOP|nr:unnamed protein product [Pieris macdunnoughi]
MSEIRNQITICVLGSDCCKRWAYVRDYYIRRKGKPGSGGEAAKKRSVLLSFLDSLPSSQRHNTISDKKLDAKKDNIMRDKKKIKLTHSEERLQILKQITKRNSTPAQNELDETDLFFNSIAKIVKKLPRYEQVQLRMQISSLVGNAELESILNDSRQTDSSTSPSSTMSFIHLETVPSPATSGTSNYQGQIVEMDGSYDERKEVKIEENLNGNEREAGRKDGRTIKKGSASIVDSKR